MSFNTSEFTDSKQLFRRSNHIITYFAIESKFASRKLKYELKLQWELPQTQQEILNIMQGECTETIITHPWVSQNIRNEFQFQKSDVEGKSKHFIKTTSNYDYKSLGNIFCNIRNWIYKFCSTKQINFQLQRKLCVDIMINGNKSKPIN